MSTTSVPRERAIVNKALSWNMRDAIRNSKKVTTAPQLAVLLACADHADKNGGSIFPSVAALAQETRHGESTVRKALKDLRNAQLLIVISPMTADGRPKGGHDTTRYQLGPELLAAIEVPSAMRLVKASPLPHRGQASTSDRRNVSSERSHGTGLADFSDLWAEKYHRPYQPDARDRQADADLQARDLTRDAQRRAMNTMLADQRDFYVRRTQHRFASFVQDIDQHLVEDPYARVERDAEKRRRERAEDEATRRQEAV